LVIGFRTSHRPFQGSHPQHRALDTATAPPKWSRWTKPRGPGVVSVGCSAASARTDSWIWPMRASRTG